MSFFQDSDQWMVRQKKEWVEIFTDWETKNQYEILSPQGQSQGFLAERAGGFLDTLLRLFLRSHRSLDIDVFDIGRQPFMRLIRPFFFFFSTLNVSDRTGKLLGTVQRRFGIIYKKYDLKDAQGRTFATIRSPIWRLWTFPIYGMDGGEAKGSISKKWGGGLREIFTDADAFLIDLQGSRFNDTQKAVAFAAAISIDFDFFENNQGSGGLLGIGDDD